MRSPRKRRGRRGTVSVRRASASWDVVGQLLLARKVGAAGKACVCRWSLGSMWIISVVIIIIIIVTIIFLFLFRRKVRFRAYFAWRFFRKFLLISEYSAEHKAKIRFKDLHSNSSFSHFVFRLRLYAYMWVKYSSRHELLWNFDIISYIRILVWDQELHYIPCVGK